MNVMIVGVGGQGTLLTSRIIGSVASANGLDVKMSEVHGMAQRGGSVVTYVRFDNKVYDPICEEGTVDVLIAFEKLEALRYAHFLKKDGVLIVNDQRINPMTVSIGAAEYPENILETLNKDHKVLCLNGLDIAKEIGNSKVLNVVILGYAAKSIGFTYDSWIDSVKERVPQKMLDINLEAFKKGYEANV